MIPRRPVATRPWCWLFPVAALLVFACGPSLGEATADEQPSGSARVPAGGAWVFSWDRRTDRDGKAAGVYESTPYPVDEATGEYTIVTDEGATTYRLGEKSYVDGARPDDAGDGKSLATAKKTIAAGIVAAGPGNKTVVVRGAHDGFDGIYRETGLQCQPGVDDTHRWTLVGYRQERPVIDAGNSERLIIRAPGQPNAFVTLHRLKLQNNKRKAIGAGTTAKKIDAYFSLVDVWVRNCYNSPPPADGSVYYMNADHGHIRHCLIEHCKGHALKVGDGSSDALVEWTVADGAGWYPDWDGPRAYFKCHPTALDFPCDRNDGFRITCRYSIARHSLFCGVQIRRVKGFSFHHNEVCNTVHFDDVKGCDLHSAGRQQVLLLGGHTSGEFYANVIRDPGASGTDAIYTSSCTDGQHAINCHMSNAGLTVNASNNSICSTGPSAAALIRSSIRDGLVLTNNILYQGAAAACLDIGPGRHSHNLYCFPRGKRGVELGAGESDGDPPWTAMPAGPYRPEMCRLTRSLPGADLSRFFRTDANGLLREQWDLGAVVHASSGR